MMPFGRYRGRLLSELPDDYLGWLATLDDLRKPLARAVAQEVRRRQDWAAESAPRITAPAPRLALEIVNVGFRRLAIQLHPDAGGDHTDMQELNAAVEWLRARLGEAA
jgi:hypothetical protein